MPTQLRTRLALFRAKRARRSEDHHKAIALLENTLTRDPKNTDILKSLACIRFEQGDDEGTVSALRRASEIEPLGAHSADLYQRAQIRARQRAVKTARQDGNFAEAARLLHLACTDNPNDIPALKELAIVHTELGDDAAAIRTLNKVQAIEPLGAHSRNLLADAISRLVDSTRKTAAEAKKQKDLLGAQDTLTKLLDLTGDHSAVLTDLATVYFQMIDNAKVIALLDRAENLAPLGPETLLIKARAHLRMGCAQPAADILAPLSTQQNAKPATFFHLAQANKRLGLHQAAYEALNALQDETIKDPKKWLLMAEGFSEIGEHAKSLEAFENCKRQGLMNAKTRMSHARAALRANDLLKAEQILLGDFEGEHSPMQRLLLLYEAQNKAKKVEAAAETAQMLNTVTARTTDEWLKIGRFHRNQGAVEKAAQSFQTARDMGANPRLVALEVAECDLKAGVLNRSASTLVELLENDPDNSRIHFVLARVLSRQGNFDKAQTHFREVIKLMPTQASAYRELAMICIHADQQEEATRLLEKATELKPDDCTIKTELAAIYLEKGLYQEARTLSEQALEIDPEKINAKMILANLALFATDTADLTVSIYGAAATEMEWQDYASDVEILDTAHVGVQAALAQANNVWIIFDLPAYTSSDRKEICNRMRGASGAVLCDETGLVAVSARFTRDVLDTLDTAITDEAFIALLLQRGREILPRLGTASEVVLLPLEQMSGEVFLISSSGHNLFGGAEHFLRGMAQLYRDLGFTPVLVGHRSSAREEGFTPDGIPFVQFTEDDEEGFRSFLLHRGPALMHVVTGSGPFVLRSTMDIDVPIIYGTHFWREMLQGRGWFPDIDRNAAPKREFKSLLLRNEAVYANSLYTLDMQYDQHAITTDVLYSLPTTVTEPAQREGRDCVLLVNSRPEKGFDILLDVAARCPDFKFVAIASQSAMEQAQVAVQQAGLQNVELLDHVEDMPALYRRAWCVMVPSYRFVETFSRVVIEAHRFGVPVIGSDRGNVPLLLTESGVALPEDPQLWAQELQRLFGDADYWAERSRQASQNSDRYPFAPQNKVLERLVKQAKRPVLVAVGNGIGNIIQCTPAIRRLSEHLDQPVDVVINQDFPGCEWLFAGSPYVGMVFGSDSMYVRRNYELVIVLASFGKAVPQFHAKRTFIARHKIPFEVTERVHESKYNLDCIEAAEIGMTYEDEDIAEYFVRDLTPTGLNSRRIVLHAGGKPGEWEVKRWPLFTELAKELMDRGWEVISTGMPHEYVPGTIDRTGTPLVETLSTIADAAYMIANDSGLMHVADGIGVPVSAIFAPTSVVKNGPLSPESQVIAPVKDCVPCQFTERFKSCKCIGEITLDDVLNKVLSHLDRLGTDHEYTAA